LNNTKRCEQGTGNTPRLSAREKDATAWANFARTGNPASPASPGSRPPRNAADDGLGQSTAAWKTILRRDRKILLS